MNIEMNDKEKIKITHHWSIPPEKGYSIGDEYIATLKPCIHTYNGECYAVLGNGKVIPNGCFSVIDAKGKPAMAKSATALVVENKRLRKLLIDTANTLAHTLDNMEGSVGSADDMGYRKDYDKARKFLEKHFDAKPANRYS